MAVTSKRADSAKRPPATKKVEQRQASEKIRTSSNLGLALSCLENCSIRNKSGLNFHIGGRHNVIRFGRKNIGERER